MFLKSSYRMLVLKYNNIWSEKGCKIFSIGKLPTEPK